MRMHFWWVFARVVHCHDNLLKPAWNLIQFIQPTNYKNDKSEKMKRNAPIRIEISKKKNAGYIWTTLEKGETMKGNEVKER